MSVLLAASLPLLALGAWVAYRALRGRPLRRFALNAVVGLVLLGYFAITASLGIFWVANQELPVFDLHYLFGYLTALLVAAHVWINAPLLARFARRARPSLAAPAQGFRPSVRWAARVIGLAAFGGLCFWIGWSRGVSVVTIVPGEPVRRPAASAEAPTGLAEQLVREGGRAVPLSRWYHQRSAHSRRGVVARGPRVDWAERPSPFESYPSLETVGLPAPPAPLTMATGTALELAAAPSPARLAAADVSLAELATLLHLTQGITDVSGPPGQPFHKRAAASSGALYPVVTHIAVGEVAGLAPGLYHYAPREHAVHLVHAGDVRATLAAASAYPETIEAAPFVLVFSTVYHRSSWKYGERGYRYCMLDAGHALANAQAAGAALGLASRVIARFDDARVADVLAVDLAAQGPVAIVPYGVRAPAAGAPADSEPGFAPADRTPARADVPDSVRLVAGRTALAITGTRAAPPPPAPPLPPRALPGATIVPLPPGDAPGDALGPVIERRRSERRFGDAALELPALAAVLERARGGGVTAQRALRVHVVAIRVAGLAPGVYEHRAGERTLALVRDGDPRDAAYEMALSQAVVERAAAVVVFSADVATMSWPDGSRGFRYAWIDAGVAAGRIYLQAVALGLGVSSVGAFFDDEVVELLRLDGEAELPVLLVALGLPAR